MDFFKEHKLYYRVSAAVSFVVAACSIVYALMFFSVHISLIWIAIAMIFAAVDGAFPNIRWKTVQKKALERIENRKDDPLYSGSKKEDAGVPSERYIKSRKWFCRGVAVCGCIAAAGIILAHAGLLY